MKSITTTSLMYIIVQASRSCELVGAWTSNDIHRRGVRPLRHRLSRSPSAWMLYAGMSVLASPSTKKELSSNQKAPSKRKHLFAKKIAPQREADTMVLDEQKAARSSLHVQQQIQSITGFRRGAPVVVEVTDFGPLGASVRVIGFGHHEGNTLPVLPLEHESAGIGLVKGLILQKEIHLFRQSRKYVDVYRGEVLNAYVERIRNADADGLVKLDICLRAYGPTAKATEASSRIWNRLVELGNTSGSILPIGTKSGRDEIARHFPGMSKVTFKRALTALGETKKVFSSDYTIRLYSEVTGLLTNQHHP